MPRRPGRSSSPSSSSPTLGARQAQERLQAGDAAYPSPLVAPQPLPPRPQPRHFHDSARLDGGRRGRDASEVADEVLANLVGLVGAEVTAPLETTARVPDGVPENVVRIVTENRRTLNFTNQGFATE